MTMLITGLAAGIVGILAGYRLRMLMARQQAHSIEQQANARLKEAREEARSILKEAQIQARADGVRAREEFELSTKARRRELTDIEDRLTQREENLDRKVTILDKKDAALNERQGDLQTRADRQSQQQTEIDRRLQEANAQLQRLAGMTRAMARRTLLERMENEVQGEIGGLLRRLQQQAREDADRNAHQIVALAVQRYAATHACEMMTSTVPLASDDIKGRIIGREGRNIRALEAETGVNMLVDDTPEAVVISGFDPVRREIARQALEHLVADGRIHPARIEEVVAKTRADLETSMRESGESALYDAKVANVPPDLALLLGRLKFRTSYAQNVLMHSSEVAHLMGMMAPELGLDPAIARRVGIFHDIGKALDHEVEGGHARIGADLLKQHGEDEHVVNAVGAHHQEDEPTSLYAILCSAADAISSSRPGARTESADIYIQRLEKLEAIANEFEGVKKTFAIQAGREIRVLVDPGQTDDNDAMVMAREISRKIEQELSYPGQIRVVVIREQRCVEYAR